MRIEPCKKIFTRNEDNEENGYIIELFKEGNKTVAYLNVLHPKAFKGYHIHTERTNRIYCLTGEVAIYTKVDEQIYITPLTSKDEQRVLIEPHTPTAIENMGLFDAILLFVPDPPYDPANKGETLHVKREEVERKIEI